MELGRLRKFNLINSLQLSYKNLDVTDVLAYGVHVYWALDIGGSREHHL